MAGPDYAGRALVLRKTKLGESDLIFTLLDADGRQRRAVGKGARKPTSPFASRLELYATVDVLCARGRSLDVLREARSVAARPEVRTSMERAAAAGPMAELLAKTTQAELAEPRLFQATEAALDALAEAPVQVAPALTAAQLLKALAFSGLRPQLGACVGCGRPLAADGTEPLRLALAEGGLVCAGCRGLFDAMPADPTAIACAQGLIGRPFAAIVEEPPALGAAFASLHLAQGLIREHAGVRLKSLEFLLSCGLFDTGLQ